MEVASSIADWQAWSRQRKAAWHPSAIDEQLGKTLHAVRGMDHIVPVLCDDQVVAIAKGDARNRDLVTWKPITHRQWCGWNTYQELIAAIAAGKIYRTLIHKEPSSFTTSDRWADLWPVGGLPPPGDYSGTADTARQFTNATTGAFMIGTQVSPATKHVVGWEVGLDSGTVNTNVMGWLYDRVLTYDGAIISNAVRTMDNTLAAQRWIDAGMPGLFIMPTITTASALGATASNLTQLTYVNQAGTPTQVIPTTSTLAWQANAAAASTSEAAQVVCPHDAGGNISYSPFLPLAAGDSGVWSIVNYQSSANNTGNVCFVLAKPIVPIFSRALGTYQKIDFSHAMLTMSRIYDDSCINACMGRILGTVTQWHMNFKQAWGG